MIIIKTEIKNIFCRKLLMEPDMKKQIFFFTLALLLFSCNNDDVENTDNELEDTGEIYKIEYYSVHVKEIKVGNAIPSYEFYPVLIKTDECHKGKNYIVANYDDMPDDWEWEKPSNLQPFRGWFEENWIDKSYITAKYIFPGEKIKITEDIEFYTVWGQVNVMPR